MLIISNNSPLSGLLAIGKLDILKTLYGKIIIPEAVKQELEILKTTGQNINPILEAGWIEVKQVSALTNLSKENLEAEAIQLALQLKADLLIIDEQKGRKIAESLGIPMVGFLGILIQAKQNSLIISLKEIFD